MDNNDFIFINNLIIANKVNYSIVLVIKYVKEVFLDVYQQILFFITSKKYCLKPYMEVSLIPEILDKYNNYVTNLESL